MFFIKASDTVRITLLDNLKVIIDSYYVKSIKIIIIKKTKTKNFKQKKYLPDVWDICVPKCPTEYNLHTKLNSKCINHKISP